MSNADLKDFFAGLAMLGLLMSNDFREEDEGIDVTAYKIADAMMNARHDANQRSEE